MNYHAAGALKSSSLLPLTVSVPNAVDAGAVMARAACITNGVHRPLGSALHLAFLCLTTIPARTPPEGEKLAMMVTIPLGHLVGILG
jgi:hypothetical protein